MLLILLLLLPTASPNDPEVLADACAEWEAHQNEPTEIEKLTTALIQAKTPEARDAAFESLVVLSKDAVEADYALVEGLTARWDATWSRMSKGSFIRKVEKLVKKREELDAARKAALDLIFDEQRYFYPYTQPEVSAKRAAEYPAVKHEVLSLVKDVRELWAASPTVRIPKNTQADLLELQWLREHQEQAKVTLHTPEGVEPWLAFLPLQAENLSFENFPLNAEEARRMERDAKVLAYNERLWEAQIGGKKRVKKGSAQTPVEQLAKEQEREQVRVTNRYRMTMGHPAVTWDPELQAAARMHSDYMAQTGNFGHYEEDPARKTPFDRMRLVGYERGVSENCSNGRSDPESAHEGWLGSSGHHRNLLMRGHLQMASATTGPFWTQNFGMDDAAEKDL